MRRLTISLLIISLVIFLAVYYHENKVSNYKFLPGRDTLAFFGDGTYQILNGPENVDLFNLETNELIVSDVFKYKRYNEKIYIVGINPKYAILDYKNQKIDIYNKFNEMSKEVKGKFKKIRFDLD